MLVVFLPVLLVLIELRFRGWPYHVFEAVRPTSGPVIISGMIYRRHVQYAVEEGLLKSNVRNHTDYQSYFFFFLFFIFLRMYFIHLLNFRSLSLDSKEPNIFFFFLVTGMYRHIQAFFRSPSIYLLSFSCVLLFRVRREKYMIIKSRARSFVVVVL